MGTLLAVMLGLGMAPAAEAPPFPVADLARLQETLRDRLHPENQSQAALLLVQNHAPEAVAIVRQGLRQTESPETFRALAAALRLCRDTRFREELLAALTGGTPAFRQPAMEALAVLADSKLLFQLKGVAEDPGADLAVRHAALWTVGQTGSKTAAAILLGYLIGGPADLRAPALEVLEGMTGEKLGADVARWQAWWAGREKLSEEAWLQESLVYQAARSRRLEGELQRSCHQVLRLHQQMYARMTLADRLGLVRTLTDHDQAAVRAQAAAWCVELYPSTDTVGRQVLVEALLQFSRDAVAEVQRPAVLALGRVSDGRAFERLHGLMKNASPTLRAAAAHALAQQAAGTGAEAQSRKPQVVPILQKALEDSSLEVVVEAAEGLGILGVPQAGPVLAVLLGHPSRPVRQTAAQALERVADPAILEQLLKGLDDSAVTVRFSLVGALGHAASEGRPLTDAQRSSVVQRLQQLMLKDTDPGVRSRAATVLGECGGQVVLAFLWERVLTKEESRVQDKAWKAMIEVLIRSANLDLLREWDQRLHQSQQPARRVQLIIEAYSSAKQGGPLKGMTEALAEMLVQVHLEQKKGNLAYPLVRELLNRAQPEAELEKRLGWLLMVGKQALAAGNAPEALRVAREAQPFLTGKTDLAGEFEQLKRQAQRR